MIAQAKHLAANHTAFELSQCMNDIISSERNVSSYCANFDAELPKEEVVGIIAKAQVLRNMMNEGMEERDAVRELGRRMRQFGA